MFATSVILHFSSYIIIQNRLKSNAFSKIEFKNNMAHHSRAQTPETGISAIPHRPSTTLAATDFAFFLSQTIAYLCRMCYTANGERLN